jgi:hypothetical protein
MPARPKRSAPADKRGKPNNKRQPQETTFKTSATTTVTTTPSTTKTTPPTLSQLFTACRQESNIHQRQRALNHWDERGALRQVIWPACLELYSKQQEQSDVSSGNNNGLSTEWLRACQLTAIFVSWENRQGVGNHQGLQQQQRQRPVGKLAWRRCCSRLT